MHPNRPSVSAIILTWNNYGDAKACIASLLKCNPLSRIIVVDNASTDGSYKKLCKDYIDNIKIRFIVNKKNWGFAKGINVGIIEALKTDADFILLLNQDTTVDPNLIYECLNVFNKNARAGIVGPRIYYHNKSRKIWHGGGYFSLLKSGIINPEKNKYDEQCDNNIRRVNFLTGCALIIRRNVFEKIGLFDENYFLYEEDVDLCIRANRAGFELYYNPAAKVWHKILSIARDRTSSFVMYNMATSHILLLRKNFSTGYFIYGLFLHFMFFTPFRIYKIMTGSQSWQAVFAWFYGSLKTLL